MARKRRVRSSNTNAVKQPQTLIITGMHRSGTSLTAAFVQQIGVNLGSNTFEADEHNRKGYFEDVDFLEFQRAVLQDSCPPEESGWHDWGWTENKSLDSNNFANYIEAAKELINSRQHNFPIWGWKDPRTSLMLDFWDDLLPSAKYLFVYRYPWDVEDSISRLKEPIFTKHRDYALKIWDYYNRQLIDFYKSHSDRIVLFNVNAWQKQPEILIELMRNKLDIEIKDKASDREFKLIYDRQIFKSLKWDSFAVKYLYKKSPQYFSMLEELDRLADLPSEFSLSAIEWENNSEASIVLISASSSEPGTSSEDFQSNSAQLNETVAKKMRLLNAPESEIAVTVVIPCYNQGEFILEAISSVESCQDRVYEILVINDKSTEKVTLNILDYLKENGYCIIEQEKNLGLASARNTGVEKARGRYILPLDSDNKIRPEYITKSIEILDKYPEVGVVYGDAEFFGERTGIWEVGEFDINKLAGRNYIDACAVYRKQVWEDCGGYDTKIPDKLGYEDWDFWLSAAEKRWKFYHIPEVLFDYRVRADSMVSLCRIPENHERLVRYICAKHLEIYKTNFANILAEKDSALLKEQIRYEGLEMELAKTQAALEESQSHLGRIQSAWEESQEQLQRIQSAWEEAQWEILRIQGAWEQAQSEVQIAHAASEKTQSELRRIQSAWDETQSEVDRIRSAWKESQEQVSLTHALWQQAQSEVDRIRSTWEQSQEELRQTHAAWEESQQKSQQQTQNIQTAWEQAQQQVQLTHSEWEQAQQQTQSIQIAWEQAQQQLQRIQSIWEQAQQQVQHIQTTWEQTQNQAQLTHSEWERSQQQLHQIQNAWEQAQQQAQSIQTTWEQAQQQVQLTHSEWERSQQQLHQIQNAWEQTQQQTQLIHTTWEQAHSQVQRVQTAWEQAHSQVQSIQTAWEQTQQQAQQSQSQLVQIQTDWERSQSQLVQIQTDWERSYSQLQIAQADLAQARSTIKEMESSKFWKLRTAWLRFKQAIGL
ncbi:glycosyltransferase [Aerosakkonema sp. BLCC-F2]